MIGDKIYALAKKLFPITRSLAGNGVGETLAHVKQICPVMIIHEVPSGTEVVGWASPKEWNLNEACVWAPVDEELWTSKKLHVFNYSIPLNTELSLEELEKHFYTLPDQPTVIPHITSYYSPRQGFSLSHKEREAFLPRKHKAVFDAAFFSCYLTYGEIIISGETEEAEFLSLFVCHPSMVTNEFSRPKGTIYLADWLSRFSKRSYTYLYVYSRDDWLNALLK